MSSLPSPFDAESTGRDVEPAATEPAALDEPATLAELEVELAPPLEVELDADPGDIVEAAEEMLRLSAPHDFQLLIIGAGPGGMAAALRAAELGTRVGIIEERRIGGTSLHRGCVPTKTLLQTIEVAHLLRGAAALGIEVEGEIKPQFATMQARKREVVERLQQQMQQKLEEAGVEVLSGRARFIGEHVVELAQAGGKTRRLIAVHLLIATGSAAHKMPIPGAELPGCVTSDEILQQNWVPPRLAVIGAGAVGLELAYLFAQLGSQVTLLEAGPHVLPEEEQEIGFEVERHLLSSQCQVLANARALRVIRQGAMLNLAYSHQGVERTLEADEVLFATPRRPRLGDLALENAGIGVEDGCVVVDGECETNVSGVYAIGDCIRGNGWAQQAVAEGIHVAELINDQMPNIDLQHTPRCYHTFPPVAVIGLGPRGAAARGWEVKTGRVEFSLNERAVTAGQETGWVQIVADASTDKILGGQIVGACASELINQIAPALKMHQTLSEFLDGACSFPAFSNLWREAARRAR